MCTKNPPAHSSRWIKEEKLGIVKPNCLEFQYENNKQWHWRASCTVSVIEHWLNIDRKMHGAFFHSLSSHCWNVPAKLNKNNRRLIFEIFSLLSPSFEYLIENSCTLDRALIPSIVLLNDSLRARVPTFLSHHHQRYLSKYESSRCFSVFRLYQSDTRLTLIVLDLSK